MSNPLPFKTNNDKEIISDLTFWLIVVSVVLFLLILFRCIDVQMGNDAQHNCNQTCFPQATLGCVNHKYAICTTSVNDPSPTVKEIKK